jgi:hypothetical protein
MVLLQLVTAIVLFVTMKSMTSVMGPDGCPCVFFGFGEERLERKNFLDLGTLGIGTMDPLLLLLSSSPGLKMFYILRI